MPMTERRESYPYDKIIFSEIFCFILPPVIQQGTRYFKERKLATTVEASISLEDIFILSASQLQVPFWMTTVETCIKKMQLKGLPSSINKQNYF
jgi:hypothetical protein